MTPTSADRHPDSEPVLTEVWDNAEDIGVDADCSPTKVCRNAREFTFDGIADEGDDDLPTSWKKLLEREGKLSPEAGSLRDLILGSSTD